MKKAKNIVWHLWERPISTSVLLVDVTHRMQEKILHKYYYSLVNAYLYSDVEVSPQVHLFPEGFFSLLGLHKLVPDLL